MKIQEKNGQCFLTIPKAILRAKRWKKGDNINFLIDSRGNIRLARLTGGAHE